VQLSSALVGLQTRAPGSFSSVRAVPLLPSLKSCDVSSFSREANPLQSSSPPSGRPTCRSDPTSLEFLVPSTASPSEPHERTGCPFPAQVPLSGFLNLSAVSWQTRVPRPCFMPQPFLRPPFRGFPSQRSRTPLEAASSLRLVTDVPCRARRGLVTAAFPDAPHLHTVGLVPATTMSSLSTGDGSPASRSPRTSTSGSTLSASFLRFEAFFSLRVRSRRPGLPRPDGRSSLGFTPL
jgi:hypothetical protein